MGTRPFNISLSAPTLNGQATDIAVPEPRNGAVIIYAHGLGENELAPRVISSKVPTTRQLMQAGYIIAATNGHGANHGNDDGVADYKALYDHLLATYNPGKVLWWCESMGGLPSLNAILQHNLRCDGWYGLEPVVNLAAWYAQGQAAVNTAYNIPAGGTYAQQTAGHDPMLYPATFWRNKRLRFVASPGDTGVPKAQHTDAFRALVAPQAIEADVVSVTGEHGDPSHYIPLDVIGFFGRC